MNSKLSITHFSVSTLIIAIFLAILVPFSIALFSLSYHTNQEFLRSIEESDNNLLDNQRTELTDELDQIQNFMTTGFSSDTYLHNAVSSSSPIAISVNLQGWLSEFNARMLNLAVAPYACTYDLRTRRMIFSYTNPIPSDARDKTRDILAQLHLSGSVNWNVILVGGQRYLFFAHKYQTVILASLIPIRPTLDEFERLFTYSTIYADLTATDEIPSIQRNRKLYVKSIPGTDLSVWVTIDQSEFKKNIPALQYIITAMAFLFMFLIPLLYWYIQRRVIRPLHHIDNALARADRGDLEHRIGAHNYAKEFTHINTSFNQMMDSITSLKMSVYEKEIQFQRHELINLQLQIKPHFLYNTFNDISSLAMMKDYKSIQIMMKDLADYFRYSVQTGFRLVPLSRELDFLDSYVNIMAMRYDGCFELDKHIGEDVKNLTIPPLLIHTFIENIMSHLIEVGSFITIELCVERHDDTAHIKIHDDGPGMSPETLAEIEKRKKYTDEFGKEHIGIWNCSKRLEYFYQGKADLSITSNATDGTTILITVPYTEEELEISSLINS